MTETHRGSDLDWIVDEMISQMLTQIENPRLLNSRFRFDEVLSLDTNFHRLNLMRGSSYLPLPDWLLRKKAIISPNNDDKECFKWVIIVALEFLNIKSHPERISNLTKFSNNYSWSGLEFPVSIKDIRIFERNNEILVNVLVIEGKDIYICRKGIGGYDRKVDLMLVMDEDAEGGQDPEGNQDLEGPEEGQVPHEQRWHYTAIKSLSRLLASKNSKNMHKQYFCTNCLQGFTQELSRDRHQAYCENNESVKVQMPIKGSKVEFFDGQSQFRVPFMMYADFESILEPIQGPSPDPAQPLQQIPTNTFPVDGVFIANSLMKMLKTP